MHRSPLTTHRLFKNDLLIGRDRSPTSHSTHVVFHPNEINSIMIGFYIWPGWWVKFMTRGKKKLSNVSRTICVIFVLLLGISKLFNISKTLSIDHSRDFHLALTAGRIRACRVRILCLARLSLVAASNLINWLLWILLYKKRRYFCSPMDKIHLVMYIIWWDKDFKGKK